MGGIVLVEVKLVSSEDTTVKISKPKTAIISNGMLCTNTTSARIYRPSFRENKPETLVFNEKNERIGLVFAKTGSINSGTVLYRTHL